MDVFDASDYRFLLPKRARRLIALALVIGIAFVPSVKSWYIAQIERPRSTSVGTSRIS